MASKKKEENLLDFQERVIYYRKQGKNHLTAIDLAKADIENDRKTNSTGTDSFNTPRVTQGKGKR